MLHDAARRADPDTMADGGLSLSDAAFRLHPSGALFWPEEGALVVADLHFEKGSSFARHGMLLPPYDTAVTLDLLADVIAFYSPKIVVALGDSFHDRAAPERLPEPYRDRLADLQAGREWIWIAGNHDPDVPEGFGGDVYAEVACGDIVFRHEPCLGPQPGEIAGHLHPAARIRVRGRSLRRRCFVTDGTRLVLPAFGVYTGGLNVCDRAFEPIVPRHAMAAHLLGRDRVYAVAGSDLYPD